MHLFTFTIHFLTNTDVPVQLAHFTRSASIFFNRKTQMLLLRGCGASVVKGHIELYFQFNKQTE